MFLVFGAGLILGGIAGMLSWLFAAAYLEAKRSRHHEMTTQPESAQFTTDQDFTVYVDSSGEWIPRTRGGRRSRRDAAAAAKLPRAGTQRPSTI